MVAPVPDTASSPRTESWPPQDHRGHLPGGHAFLLELGSTEAVGCLHPGAGAAGHVRGHALGELIALRRHHIDLEACEIRVVETTAQLDTGRLLPETPKSRAGRRTVAFPADLVPEIRWHLERFAEPGEQGLVFVGPKGARLRRSNFGRIWARACAKAGVPGVHFHDLRHTGGTLAAATGATLKELMVRLGDSSTRAALIYQHATRDRDQAIATALGDLARQVRAATDARPEEPRENA
jgi:integrase